MSKAKAWSLIDTKPVLQYIPEFDDCIVYWNGIVMPHKMALCIAGTLLNIYPTPEMKVALHENYCRLYYANVFGSRPNWDKIVQTPAIYDRLMKYMQSHLSDLKQQNIPGPEILKWFDYTRAVTE